MYPPQTFFTFITSISACRLQNATCYLPGPEITLITSILDCRLQIATCYLPDPEIIRMYWEGGLWLKRSNPRSLVNVTLYIHATSKKPEKKIGNYEPNQMNTKWQIVLRKKRINGNFGLFSALTVSMCHKRLHVNALMAQGVLLTQSSKLAFYIHLLLLLADKIKSQNQPVVVLVPFLTLFSYMSKCEYVQKIQHTHIVQRQTIATLSKVKVDI